jgi:hypothetical protein
MQDRRAFPTNESSKPQNRSRVMERRDITMELVQRFDPNPSLLGDERHRLLAARDGARHESCVVAAIGEPGGEVGDV